MELLTLKTFIAVIEEGGVLAASKRLNTVQSNVTTRIHRLEDELGSPLFHRRGRGLELSPAGRVLHNYAKQLLLLETQTQNAIRMVGQSEGTLRIGSIETFAAVHLPHVLRKVRKQHPDVELNVQGSTSQDLLQQVLDFKLDCAFVVGPIDSDELRYQEVMKDELAFVRSKNGCSSETTLIQFKDGCTYRANAISWMNELGRPVDEIMEIGTLEGILGCVAVGLGSTLMPRTAAELSRYSNDLIIEQLPVHLSSVSTKLVTHIETPPMACVQTLAASTIGLTDQRDWPTVF
ncbi:LysR family transcriptional regulator [Vibrio sp. WJH972]